MLKNDILKLAVPVGLEAAVTTGTNWIAQLVVASLGSVAVGAVGLANQYMFIGLLCLSSFSTGASVLISKAQGANDAGSIKRMASLSVLVGAVLSVLMCVLMLWTREPLFEAFKTQVNIRTMASSYIGLLSLTLVTSAVSYVAGSVLRVMGKPTLPLLINVITSLPAPLIGWLLLGHYGVSGMAYGIVGTSIVRTLLMLWCIREYFVSSTWFQTLEFVRQFVPLVAPLFVTEIFFASGQFIYSALFERVGVEPLAAFNIQQVIETLFIVMCLGFNNAGAILVANALGKQNPEEAYGIAKTILSMAVKAAVVCGLLYAASGFFIPQMYPDIAPATQKMATLAIWANALLMPVKVTNMTMFGVLSAGGKTVWLLFSDIVTVFVFGLPVAYVCGIAWGWGFWGLYVGRLLSEEFSRVAMLLHRLHSGRWFKL